MLISRGKSKCSNKQPVWTRRWDMSNGTLATLQTTHSNGPYNWLFCAPIWDTYARQIWSPQSIELTTRLERIQRPATKYILIPPFSITVNNVPRLQSPFLSPVCYWRDYLDLVLLFKIAHGLVKVKATHTQSHLYTRTAGLLDFHLALLFVMPYLNARLPPIKDPSMSEQQ